MTTKDVRDMLGLPSETIPHPPKLKKQKTGEKRSDNLNRELSSLLGERAPPVAIIDKPRYKEKPKRTIRTRPWRMTPFINQARKDGLQLRHWERRELVVAPVVVNMDLDGQATEEVQPSDSAVSGPVAASEYRFAKYDVHVEGPKYNDEQYDTYLRSDDWDKEETDYLVGLVGKSYQRWPVVVDRYDFKPAAAAAQSDGEDATSLPAPKERTMEDMKARYYDISAKMMAVRKPISTMSTSEFERHELMTTFDGEKEMRRKRIAESLMARTPEQVKEEEFLLAELQRIVVTQERMDAERRELRERLEYPQASPGSTQPYRTSVELDQLYKHFQQLYRADKSRGRLSLRGPGGDLSPAGQTQTPRDAAQRESLASAGSQKKGSLVTPTTEGRDQPARHLPEAQEARFGIRTHEERLTGGASFVQEKVSKLRAQGKTQAQKQKVEQALVELKIPEQLILPTPAVVEEFGKLLQKILLLTDARRLAEKVDGEIRVLKAQLEPSGGSDEDGGEGKDEEDAGPEGDTEMTDAPEQKDENEGGEAVKEENQDADEE